MKFGEEKQAEIFKKLAYNSAYQVGIEYGFDKVYNSPQAIRNAVTSIKTRVRNNPENYAKWGITPEVLTLVKEASTNRTINKGLHDKPSIAEQSIDKNDIKALLTGIRDKVFTLIDRKVDMVGRSRKKLDNTSFKELGIIAGITFDKAQILQGLATENISVMSKIEDNISPEDALNMISKIREVNNQANDNRNK